MCGLAAFCLRFWLYLPDWKAEDLFEAVCICPNSFDCIIRFHVHGWMGSMSCLARWSRATM